MAESTVLPSGGILRVSELRTVLALPRREGGWSAISSAVLNGGISTNISAVINSRTAADYDGLNPSPEPLLRGIAEDEGFVPASTIGLLTAASMKTARTSTRAADGVVVDVIVTCGISNAREAGADADYLAFDDAGTEPGTINTIIVTNATLTAAALVEAHAVSVESKCAECARMGLVCAKSPGSLAQGTGTDATVVVAAGCSSRHVRYAGKHTLFAELLGQATREATRAALLVGVCHMHGSIGRYWMRTWARRTAAALQGTRPCIPATPMSPVPRPPRMVVLVGLTVVTLCYSAPLPHSARVLLGAVAWDRWFGEPPLTVHPVVLVGNLISFVLRRTPDRVFSSPNLGLACGATFVLGMLAVSLLGCHFLLAVSGHVAAAAAAAASAAESANALGAPGSDSLLRHAASAAAGACHVAPWLVEVVLLKSAIGGQLLGSVALQMARLLERRQLSDARAQLSWLCSRDPSALAADELTGGTLESLAENLSDGFVAPLLWYAVCGPLGALGYRVANTLDSRVGYHGKFEWFGKPAARLDDLINLLPARITAVLLASAALVVPGCDGWHGLRVAWRDCMRCESPNAGWPMAAMAGLLGVRLEKPGCYSLGEANRPLGPQSIRDGLRTFQLACGVATMLAVLISLGATW